MRRILDILAFLSFYYKKHGKCFIIFIWIFFGLDRKNQPKENSYFYLLSMCMTCTSAYMNMFLLDSSFTFILVTAVSHSLSRLLFVFFNFERKNKTLVFLPNNLIFFRWVSKLIRKRHSSSVTSVAWHPNNVSALRLWPTPLEKNKIIRPDDF